MRHKYTVVSFGLILFLLVGLLYRCSPASDSLAELSPGMTKGAIEPPPVLERVDPPSDEGEAAFLDKVQEAITFQNSLNSKFEFYGLVIDQDGKPIPDAEVQINTRAYKRSVGLKLDYTRDDFIRKEEVVFTDATGRFKFDDGYGSGLTIKEISKAGYVSARGKKNIIFLSTSGGKHKPDSSNPVVYTMWKKAGAEPLIKEEFSFKFSRGDPPQGVSLREGRWIKTNTKDADLIISASMGDPNPNQRYRFDWEMAITVVNGGLIETNDVFPFEAPEAEYKESFSFSKELTSSGWASSMSDKIFYVKARGGSVYASIRLDFNVHRSGRFFSTMEVLVNPNGSRNLEYDPELRIKP